MFSTEAIIPVVIKVGKIAGLIATGYAVARTVDTVRAYRSHNRAVEALKGSGAPAAPAPAPAQAAAAAPAAGA